jgi:hypothetical protein
VDVTRKSTLKDFAVTVANHYGPQKQTQAQQGERLQTIKGAQDDLLCLSLS